MGWTPYGSPGTEGSTGGTNGNLPPPLSQFQINQIVTTAIPWLSTLSTNPAAIALSLAGWLQSLPTGPQTIPGWWNNGGIPVYS